MNKSTTIGIILVILGGLGLALEGVSWTERETVIDVGPLEASADVRRSQTIPPLLAGGVLILGIGFTVYGATRKG